MINAVRFITIPLVLMVLLTWCDLFGTSKTNPDPLPDFSKNYDPAHDPEANLEFAISMAKESNRRILMLVGGDWCPWCRALDTFFKEDADLYPLLHENFVLLKVYYGRENYNRNFLSGFPKLVATPHLYVLESDGTHLHSQGSEVLEKGRSYDALKVMAFLQRWLPEKKDT